MRVVVLTANPVGIASRFLARGSVGTDVQVVGALLDEGVGTSRRSLLRARLRKVRRVGVTWLPVGLALRRLYAAAGSAGVQPIDTLGVAVHRVPTLNGDEARECLGELRPDLCVSLDNRLIEASTFTFPRLGTINIHHGAVPEFRGGPPVFWELFEGRSSVGYTVHQIDAGIDTGPVLAGGQVPIRRRATLGETLLATIPSLHEASLDALESVLDGLASGAVETRPQPTGAGGHRTTPRLVDYLRVRKMLRAAGDD